ncbi:MAG TPA: pyridoxal-dependent decarboxylase, partial [Gemmatimonadales bacterium]|nr:pyridoxal-dependent decarboxylase [Gemmatimonadales bacterium]
MDSELFRAHAHEVADWLADYLRDVGRRPVLPPVAPGQIRSQLPADPPASGEPFEQLLADFDQLILPGITHWQHPGWFGYFPANASPPSILAEMLTAGLAAQCMSWQTSPAATELEQHVMGWLRDLLGLPADFTGVIQDTASTSTLVALLTARERATDFAAGVRGLDDTAAPPLTVYTSAEAHSSVAKGVKLAGFGLDRLRSIETDQDYAVRPDRLAQALEYDRRAGFKPACVVATVGTTSSTALDPLRPIGELCREYGAWFHVDASYAGSAAVLPDFRWILDGVELADSFVVNPHKWLLVNFDCSAYFVRDVDALLHTFQASPEYLRTARDAEVVNFRDWGIQLGRRFRALKLWFVIRSYGVDGLRAMVRRHIELAAEFRRWVDASPEFEAMAPTPLALVCFRWHPVGVDDGAALDELNRRVLAAINATGSVFLTHTLLGGRYVLRLAVGQWQTTEADVSRAWRVIQQAAAELAAAPAESAR